jgi:excisionase family DNA binding protein
MTYLKKSDVAKLLNVSVRTVDRLREKNLLPAVKIMDSVRFRPEDVRAYLEGLRRQASADWP